MDIVGEFGPDNSGGKQCKQEVTCRTTFMHASSVRIRAHVHERPHVFISHNLHSLSVLCARAVPGFTTMSKEVGGQNGTAGL